MNSLSNPCGSSLSKSSLLDRYEQGAEVEYAMSENSQIPSWFADPDETVTSLFWGAVLEATGNVPYLGICSSNRTHIFKIEQEPADEAKEGTAFYGFDFAEERMAAQMAAIKNVPHDSR